MRNKLKQIFFIIIFSMLNASISLVMDLNSDEILVDKNSNDEILVPNFSKLMTIYITLEHLKRGEITLSDEITLNDSEDFSKDYKLKDLIPILMIANKEEVCSAIAKHISGSIPAFVKLMNQQSKLLLMNATFEDPLGSYDNECITSAKDIAILIKALMLKHQNYFKIFKNKYHEFYNTDIINDNDIIHRTNFPIYALASGMNQGNYNSAVFIKNKNMFLVSISLEDSTLENNNKNIIKGINYALENFETFKLYDKGQEVSEHRVWYGNKHSIKTGFTDNIYITIPKYTYHTLKAVIKYNPKSFAPINIGDVVGVFEILNKDSKIIKTSPVISLENVVPTNIYFQGLDFIIYNLFQRRNFIEQNGFTS